MPILSSLLLLCQVLDLSSNNLVTIEGLKDINLLSWLSLANNNIKAMDNLNQVCLAHKLNLKNDVGGWYISDKIEVKVISKNEGIWLT